MKNATHLSIAAAVVLLACLLAFPGAAQDSTALMMHRWNGASDATLLQSQPADDAQPLYLTCGDASTPYHGSLPVDVRVNGAPIACPAAKDSPRLGVARAASVYAATKMYFFSNVGTQTELDLHLRKIGVSEVWIKKNSAPLLRAIKSRPANRVFAMVALAEVGATAYAGWQTYFVDSVESTSSDASSRSAVAPPAATSGSVPSSPPTNATSSSSIDCSKTTSLAAQVLCDSARPPPQ